MTNEELRVLKEKYDLERIKREEIHKLLVLKDVSDFLRLTDNNQLLFDIKNRYSLEPEDIIRYLVGQTRLSGSSEIYFCSEEKRDPYLGIVRKYSNLENYDHGYIEKVYDDDVEKFEREHDVLDEQNPLYQEDGIRRVQSSFFQESFANGQERAKKMILEKYGTIKKAD